MDKNLIMIWIFALGVVWLAYVYAGYPFLLAVYTRLRRIRPAVRDGIEPLVSVLISARNEEKDIRWKVDETLSWDYPPDKLEVLVASDASDDNTDAILAAIPDPRLRFFRMEKRGGKNAALNYLVSQARGEILFFTDANAHIGPDSLRRMIRHFADPRVGCVTGNLQAIAAHEDLTVAGGARAYWGYEELIRRLESSIGRVLVAIGAIFCLRRNLFKPLLPELANDLELPLRVGQAGAWVLYEPQAVVVERETQSAMQEFARRRRICAQGILASWKLRDALTGVRGWQFFSRKFLRWFGLFPQIMIFAASLSLRQQPEFAALLAMQVIFYGLAAVGFLVHCLGGRLNTPLLSLPFYTMLVNVAGIVAAVDVLRGRRFATWEIPTLSRGSESENAVPEATPAALTNAGSNRSAGSTANDRTGG